MLVSYIVVQVINNGKYVENVKLPNTFATMIDMYANSHDSEWIEFRFEAGFDEGMLIMDENGLRFVTFEGHLTSEVIPLEDLYEILHGNLAPPCEPDYITLEIGQKRLASA